MLYLYNHHSFIHMLLICTLNTCNVCKEKHGRTGTAATGTNKTGREK